MRIIAGLVAIVAVLLPPVGGVAGMVVAMNL